MTTVGEVIQRVQSPYSKGVQSKDTRLTSRHIYSCLCSARSTLLQQKANKNQPISHWNYQTIPCVGLIKAPLHECVSAPKGQLMLRSEFKLPKIVSGLRGELTANVSTLDGSVSFDKKQYNSFTYHKGKKFTSTKPFYFFRNEYLYLGSSKDLKAIFFPAIFHDPVEAYFFESACADECPECKCKDVYDLEFPIDGDLIRPLIQIANEEAIILFKQMTQDSLNNAADDDNLRGSMIHQPQTQG